MSTEDLKVKNYAQLSKELEESNTLLSSVNVVLAAAKLAIDNLNEEKKQLQVKLSSFNNEEYIVLPRNMDEDLYYIVGGAMGAQSPEQCGRADILWDKLVARADRDSLKVKK